MIQAKTLLTILTSEMTQYVVVTVVSPFIVLVEGNGLGVPRLQLVFASAGKLLCAMGADEQLIKIVLDCLIRSGGISSVPGAMPEAKLSVYNNSFIQRMQSSDNIIVQVTYTLVTI